MILFDQSGTASTNPQGLIQQAWAKYKGNTNWPSPGTAKYLLMVILVNQIKDEYALDANVHWDSLFVQNNNLGTIVATQQQYSLPTNVFYLSDGIYILRNDGSGNTDRYKVVHPEQRNDYNNALGSQASDFGDPPVYLTGSFEGGVGNLALNFVVPFQVTSGGSITNSPDVGGTIQGGTYVWPADLVNPTDKVPINNPKWAVVRLAAEMSRTDPSKEDQYPNLIQEANDLYAKMVRDNQGNSYEQPSGPTVIQQKIGVLTAQV